MIKVQNFWSWEYSSHMLDCQDVKIIHQIDRILLFIFWSKWCLINVNLLNSSGHVVHQQF
jgi:hypothetical protein